MTLRTLTSRAIGLAAFLLVGAATLYMPQSHAQGINLTPAQIQQLQNLSEEERQALLAQAGGQVGERQQQIPEEVNLQQAADTAPSQAELAIQQDAQARQQQDRIESDQQQQSTAQPLTQYGYELFAGAPTTFAPATNIPVPANYVMGPGDTVILQLYGQRNLTHELVITREGMLMFPEIGPVSVAGLTFQELRDQLQSIVANQLIGQNVSVTLGALRSINVFVLGEAVQPGSYTVSSLSTMTNALFASGGVTRVGSLRDIRLMRNGELITSLDLYDLLLRGDTSGDARLLPGDVIFIPPIGKTVGIAGEVRRPAIYEISDETSPTDILSLAGGLNPTAYPRASRIERINELGERTIVDVDLSQGAASNPLLSDGDVIQVYSVLDQVESVVMLEGHVQRPGAFQWRSGLRVSDVIPSVAAMLPNPDLEYALIAREVQPTRRIELVYVNLGAAINNPGGAQDLTLEARDRLYSFGASQNRQSQVADLLDRLRSQASFENPPLIVTVEGNVRFPGEYPLFRNMTVDDVIRFAGGLGTNSDLDYLLLERRMDRQGSIEVLSTALNPQTLQTQTPVALQELDRVMVFNVGESRQSLLEPTLQRLRDQSSTSEPTRIVSVTGRVRHPGNYPLTPGLDVNRLIEIAGGLTESAETRNAEVTRYDAEPATGREIGHVNINLMDGGNAGLGFDLAPFDQLVIRQMPNWTDYETVTIEGEVNSPGTYTISKDEPLTSLIERAGGMTAHADPRAAIFLREDLRQNEQRMLEEFRDQLERDVITQRLQGQTSSRTNDPNIAAAQTAGMTDLLDRISEVRASGRLVINLPKILAAELRPEEVPILRDGDRLLIPRTQQEVSVLGEVHRPTSHLYDRRLSVADYINRSGGMTEDADRKAIYVIKANGEVVSSIGSRWFFQERANLNAGDSIIVPFDTYQPNYIQSWTSITQILFNLSTTLLAIDRVGQ
ncbi:MAG: SLBB domain-containing protein [Pseudomonadales bacterium]|nr:SLBB domain-containing protein [Pseudomonadales bacterium]